MRTRMFFDMDGTLAKFKIVASEEELYQEGYFRGCEPMGGVIASVKDIIHNCPEKEVFILSAYLSDSPFALREKNEWLDKYLPEIDEDHRIFCPCGKDKSKYIDGGIRETDILIDDYTVNLFDWKAGGGLGVKLLNGINDTRGSWKGWRAYDTIYDVSNFGRSDPAVLLPEYDYDQMEQIRAGWINNVDVSVYASAQYSAEQMEVMREGLLQGVDVSVYSENRTPAEMRKFNSLLSNLTSFDKDQRKEIAMGIEHELPIDDICQYAKLDIPAAYMHLSRAAYEAERDAEIIGEFPDVTKEDFATPDNLPSLKEELSQPTEQGLELQRGVAPGYDPEKGNIDR